MSFTNLQCLFVNKFMAYSLGISKKKCFKIINRHINYMNEQVSIKLIILNQFNKILKAK